MIQLSDNGLQETDATIRVVHVVGSTRVDHGGTSRSVPAICEALAERDVDVQLLTGKTEGVQSNVPKLPVVTRFVDDAAGMSRALTGRRFSSELAKWHSAHTGTAIVHDHGIWLPSNHAAAKSVGRSGGIRVVSPRGMASPWALSNGGIKKRVAWHLYQKNDLASATAFHATADLEATELRQLGLTQPIAVLPNGIDLPPVMPTRRRSGGKKRMVFMSRIHPKKGLMNLVMAWKAADISDVWELLLIGPDEGGHRREIERLTEQLGLSSCIRFHGEVSDTEKWQELVDADLFVLPSFSENFGIVVAEALAAGLPVITTTGTPWGDLVENDIGWWIPPDQESLQQVLVEACRLPDSARIEMSQRAAGWAGDRFQWSGIAARMFEFYSWLLHSGTVPEFVNVA